MDNGHAPANGDADMSEEESDGYLSSSSEEEDEVAGKADM